MTATDGTVNLSGNDRQTRNGTNAETAFVSGLFANTVGQGAGGNITIRTQDLNITEGAGIEVNSTGRGSGDAGDVTIIATGDVGLSGRTQSTLSGKAETIVSTISSNVNDPKPIGQGLLGSGGTITLNANNLTINQGATISAKTLGDNTAPPAAEFLNGTALPSAGMVDINVDNTIALSDVIFAGDKASPTEISVSATGAATVGVIDVDARTINIENGARLNASTVSVTPSDERGRISVNAQDTLTITGFGITSQENFNPALFRRSQIVAVTAGAQNGGNITVTGKNLVVQNGGLIDSTASTTTIPTLPPNTTPAPDAPRAETTGAGGNISVIVDEDVTISGRATKRASSGGTKLNSQCGSKQWASW